MLHLILALSGGITWIVEFSSYGSGGHKKGLTSLQTISILVTCCIYLVLLLTSCKYYRKVRQTGGPYGISPDKNDLFEDKILKCLGCCLQSAHKMANDHLDKHDA